MSSPVSAVLGMVLLGASVNKIAQHAIHKGHRTAVAASRRFVQRWPLQKSGDVGSAAVGASPGEESRDARPWAGGGHEREDDKASAKVAAEAVVEAKLDALHDDASLLVMPPLRLKHVERRSFRTGSEFYLLHQSFSLVHKHVLPCLEHATSNAAKAKMQTSLSVAFSGAGKKRQIIVIQIVHGQPTGFHRLQTS